MQIDLKKYISSYQDFPMEGVQFLDITPLLLDPIPFNYTIEQLALIAKQLKVDLIVGPDARGFLFGTPVAYHLNLGFVPIRKEHKLPGNLICVDYNTEYNHNCLCIQENVLKKGQRVFIIDDILATGGTSIAVKKIVEKQGAIVVGYGFVIELETLNGRQFINDENIYSLVKY